jgi:hypothetical protein
MAASVTHTKVSTVPDGPDTDLIRPGDWNATHTVSISASDVGAEPAGTVANHTGDTSAAHAASAVSADSTTLVGTGTDVQAVLEELDNGIADHIGDTSAAHAASAISADSTTLVGTGTDVQAVLEELDNAIATGLLPQFIPVTFSKQGTVAVTTEAAVMRWYNDSGRALTIDSVRASVNTAPTGASLIVDVNYDGTTIYTTGPGTNRPTITATNFTAEQGGAPDVTSVADGHYLSVNVDAVGSTIPGSDLTVQVWLRG